MALLDVLIYPDENLAKVCQPVEQVDDALRQFIEDMFETMYQHEGIGWQRRKSMC